MSKFNIGDKVIRTGSNFRDLKHLGVYLVKDIFENRSALELQGSFYEFNQDKFELYEFNIRDLEDGMVVEYQNGERAMFLNNGFSTASTFTPLGDTDFSLVVNGIVKVHDKYSGSFYDSLCGHGDIIWKSNKPDPKSLEIENIESKIELLKLQLNKLRQG